MKHLATLAIAATLLAVPLALPASAHNRCDHRDHSHWARRGGPVYERWRYLRMEFGNGRIVRLPSSACR